MKKNFNGLYLLLIISIIILCVFSCTQTLENENEGEDQKEQSNLESTGEETIEKADTPLAVIQLGDNQFVEIVEPEEGDLYICGVSNSIENIRNVRSMSLVELYEKYVGKKAPEALVKAQERSNYVPEDSNSIKTFNEDDSATSRSMSYSTAQNYYYSTFPGTIITYYVCACGSSSHSFVLESKDPYYISALAASNSGHFNYKMYRRVIRAFKSNYWKTVAGPYTIYDGQYVWSKCCTSNRREIKSYVYNNTGTFHHIIGGN